jgi:hypothetical protein
MGSDTTGLFEFGEEIFNQVPDFVHVFIVFTLVFRLHSFFCLLFCPGGMLMGADNRGINHDYSLSVSAVRCVKTLCYSQCLTSAMTAGNITPLTKMLWQVAQGCPTGHGTGGLPQAG